LGYRRDSIDIPSLIIIIIIIIIAAAAAATTVECVVCPYNYYCISLSTSRLVLLTVFKLKRKKKVSSFGRFSVALSFSFLSFLFSFFPFLSWVQSVLFSLFFFNGFFLPLLRRPIQ